MRRRIVTLSGMLVLLAACSHSRGGSASPAPAQPGPACARLTVMGTVREEATGQPVAWGLVQLDGGGRQRSAGTDSTGRYRFENLPEGSYTIEAGKPGFYTERRDVAYSSGAMMCVQFPAHEETLDFHLRPQRLPLES